MKIDTQPRDDHQVKLIVEYEPDILEKYKHKAARKISLESKVHGFRPGKAPYDVVKRLYGDDAITNQAVDLIIDATYSDILEQADIKPGGPGSLEKLEGTDPLKLNIIVPLYPTVDLGDYRSVRLEYAPVPVKDEEIDKFIERIRTNYASVEPVERPVQETDLVSLNISGKLVAPAEGEDADIVKETPQQVIVQPEDQQSKTEWPFPGFARQLIGLATDEEKTLTYVYPEDAKDDKFKGKEVVYTVKIQTIKSVELPELNDDFAQMVGEFASFEDMKKTVVKRLEDEAKVEYDNKFYTQIIDQIRAMATIKYPPQTLEEEIQHSLESLEHDLSHQKLDLDTYLKIRKTTKQALIDSEIKPMAVRRLESSLIVEEVANVEKIELNKEKLEGEVSETVAEMEQSGTLQRLRRNNSTDNVINAVAMDVATRMMNQQALERLKDIATGKIEAEAAAQETKEELKAEEVEKPAETPVAEEKVAENTPAEKESSASE